MPAPDRKRRLTAFLVALAVLVATPLAVVAADAFTDVPDSNVFHDDIAWLADANVTKGCNPPDNTEFCPSDNVTREQMAAFMRRLAQNKVVDAATAETADDSSMLGGEGPDHYRTVTAADIDSNLTGSTATELAETNSITLMAPAPGVVVVSGSALIRNTSGATNLFGVRPAVNGTLLQGAAGNASFSQLASDETESMSYTVAFEVAAGTHSITQSIAALNLISGAPITGSFFYNANQLTATWHPEGSITLATAGSGDGSFAGE